MYAKLDKIRADLQKAITKRDEADAKVKQLEEKLREEEGIQIVNDVASYNMTPEQLAQFLQLANSGKLQELLSGQNKPAATSYTSSYSANRTETEVEEDNEDDDI